jgi:AcrR family transcriptional regulator
MPSKRRSKVRLKRDVRREQIIREATRLISESGFNAVSLADIAGACGIRKPSVLHYFPSMTHLLEAVLLNRDRMVLLEAGGPVGPIASPAEARAAFTSVLEMNLASKELTRLFHILSAEALSPQHPAYRYFVERLVATQKELQLMLAWKQDPEVAAIQLFAFWQGIELEWLREPRLDIRRVWSAFCDNFFQ